MRDRCPSCDVPLGSRAQQVEHLLICLTPTVADLAGRPRPGWEDHAACAGVADVGEWTARVQHHSLTLRILPLLRVCASCPVRLDCAAEACRHPTPLTGVWGGTTDITRRPLRAVLAPPASSSQARETAAECGSSAGYQRHLRDGDRPCDLCADAWRDYQRAWRERQRQRRRMRAG